MRVYLNKDDKKIIILTNSIFETKRILDLLSSQFITETSKALQKVGEKICNG